MFTSPQFMVCKSMQLKVKLQIRRREILISLDFQASLLNQQRKTYISCDVVFDNSLLLGYTTCFGSWGDAESSSLSDTVGTNTVVRRPHMVRQHRIFVQFSHTTVQWLKNNFQTYDGLKTMALSFLFSPSDFRCALTSSVKVAPKSRLATVAW